MNGRWELFLECFRPNPPSRNTPVTDLIRSLEELKGTEAVSILIGRSTNLPTGQAHHLHPGTAAAGRPRRSARDERLKPIDNPTPTGGWFGS